MNGKKGPKLMHSYTQRDIERRIVCRALVESIIDAVAAVWAGVTRPHQHN